MTYFEGFIVPVPEANRAAYQKHADEFAPVLCSVGVGRMVESWDSDVPEGKVTDFRKRDKNVEKAIRKAFDRFPK